MNAAIGIIETRKGLQKIVAQLFKAASPLLMHYELIVFINRGLRKKQG